MDYLITQFAVIATYLRLLILPINQNLDYDYPIYSSLAQARPLLGLLLHLALIGVAIYAWRKAGKGQRAKGEGKSKADHSPFTIHHSLVAFGIFWFYLTLSVESGIIPIKDVIFEHRVYLPSAGIALAAVTGLVLLSRWLSSKLLFSLMAILLVGLAAATIKRNMVWQSPIAVWEDIVAKSPNKLRPYYNLGCEYAKNDDMASAIKYFQQSIKIKETQPECHNNLGSAYIRTERMDEALYHIQRALELNPSYSMAYFNLGLVYAYKGQSKDAVNSIEKAIELDPKNHEFKSKLELLKQYL
jgi:tetratricopeptide (TPR) repeat protein